jgi:hypothetical protein
MTRRHRSARLDVRLIADFLISSTVTADRKGNVAEDSIPRTTDEHAANWQ